MADSGGDETEEKGPFSASEASALPRESGHLCGTWGAVQVSWWLLDGWIFSHPKSVDKMLVLDKMDDFFLWIICHSKSDLFFFKDWKPWMGDMGI